MLYIDLPTRGEIERLAADRAEPTVSIYLRTTPVTQDTGTDRLELKALLRTAVEQMEAAGTPKRSLWPIEEAITGLAEDRDFWAVQANSLAVFATPERLLTYRLPNHLQPLVEVSDRAHLKPLLRALTFPHNAYVLAISLGACRLVEVTADLPPHPVEVPGLPRSFEDAVGRRNDGDRSAGMRAGHHTSEHAQFARYCRAVDAALRPVITGHERPLIVAAADPLASIYRANSTYPHTARHVIPGSADHTPDHELAAAARGILDAVYADELRELAALYDLREGQGRSTGDIAQAARAATFGAIDTLIFDMDEVVHGTIDEETGAVAFADAPDAGSYGLVDEIAARALRSGARLLAARRADIPGGGSLAAILRYPV